MNNHGDTAHPKTLLFPSSFFSVALWLSLALASICTVPAQEFTQAERQAFKDTAAVKDPAARVTAAKKFLTDYAKSPFVPFAWQVLVAALIEAKAPTAEVVAAGEAAVAAADEELLRAQVYEMIASELAERGERLEQADEYARKAVAAVPSGEELKAVAADMQGTLGWVQLKRGKVDLAVATLASAGAGAPNDQEILYHLGAAYEKAGKSDEAIDAYVRSLAVFLGRDARAEVPLRALYQRRHGSLTGLEERIVGAREASRWQIAFESRRYEKPAPVWELKDLAGKPVKLSDYKGKIVVMDFWGSWCPSCREELPSFQALYERYQDKGVVFLAINWERPDDPQERLKKVADFIAASKYTFPVIIDHDRVAVGAYEIHVFPTIFMIDKTGTIRYRNIGDDQVDQIVEAQLESMLK